MPAESNARSAFLITAPGLEHVTAAELSALGVEAAPQTGGIPFDADLRTLYRANLELRSASRVIVRIGSFRARALGELARRSAALPWEQFLRAGQRVEFRVTSRKSRLYHTGAIADRLAEGASKRLRGDVIGQQLQQAEAEDDDEGGERQLIIARLSQDECTISIDSSGTLLHKRGYRQEAHRAPMRETLAAALLMRAGYSGSVPLVDPMCGSGTIAIEGALIARNIAPGAQRSFAFERWPDFDVSLWRAVHAEAQSREIRADRAMVMAFDRDDGAISATTANARRAGVAEAIQARSASLSAAEPPGGEPGILATNPPYGVRLSDETALRDLYARFGQVVQQRFAGWSVVMVSANPRLAAHADLAWRELLRTRSGGLPISVLVSDPAGRQSRAAKRGRPSRRSR